MRRFKCLLLIAALLLPSAAARAEGHVRATLFKNPACGCCEAYAHHLRKEGYAVNVVEKDDLSPVKRQFGVPETLESCHTV